MHYLSFIGVQELILLLVFVVPFLFILPLIALILVVTNQFEGNDKLMWVLIILFLPILGSLLYFIFGHGRRLK
ncbi:phospholipase_D-nuclease N-terminal [Bacteroidales bacterium 6E]|jgi:hypothetical protein|nr:phospholipase_D-nuclease N-terminal [Bacteroidales bacterium 6E]